jgi:hypothetical protein
MIDDGMQTDTSGLLRNGIDHKVLEPHPRMKQLRLVPTHNPRNLQIGSLGTELGRSRNIIAVTMKKRRRILCEISLRGL